MSADRPDCLKPAACVAKKPGRHCLTCTLTARNKSERQREAARAEKLARPTLTEEAAKKSATPEVRARAAQSCRERALGWCPPAYRADYRRLVRSKRYLAHEARALIEQAIEHDRTVAARREIEARHRAMLDKHARDLAQRY